MGTVLLIILTTAATLTALGVIWRKGIKPLARFISTAEQMIPLLVSFNAVFKNNPSGFKVLNEIAAQFRTDSGSSLRDAVNRLEVAAEENRVAALENRNAADALKIGVEAQRLLDIQDREMIRALTLKLDRVNTRVTESAATGIRLEEGAAHIAEDLAARQKE